MSAFHISHICLSINSSQMSQDIHHCSSCESKRPLCPVWMTTILPHWPLTVMKCFEPASLISTSVCLPLHGECKHSTQLLEQRTNYTRILNLFVSWCRDNYQCLMLISPTKWPSTIEITSSPHCISKENIRFLGVVISDNLSRLKNTTVKWAQQTLYQIIFVWNVPNQSQYTEYPVYFMIIFLVNT